MSQTKKSSTFSKLLLSIFILGSFSQNIQCITLPRKTLIASFCILGGINALWNKLAERAGSSDIAKRAQKAKTAPETIAELKPKWKNGTITSQERKELLKAIWHIIDAEWIGFYKKPKERINISYKLIDGRTIACDYKEKTSGSIGIGKIYQNIELLCGGKKLLQTIGSFVIGVFILEKILTTDLKDLEKTVKEILRLIIMSDEKQLQEVNK